MEINRHFAIMIGCWLYNSLLLTSFFISCPIRSLSGKITKFLYVAREEMKIHNVLVYLKKLFSGKKLRLMTYKIFLKILDWHSPI